MKSFILGLSFLVSSVSAHAFDSTPSCYKFEVPDGPEASSVVSMPRWQTWCYDRLVHPAGAVFVFNADGDSVKPELSALVEADGVLTHASLRAGEISIHRLSSPSFSPLPVPLTEPVAISSGVAQELKHLDASAAEVLKQFLSGPTALESLAVEAGNISRSVPANAMPWRGYWWPYHNQPLSGTNQSPLAKYDRFVAARTGSNPRTAAWENANHRYKGIKWEGHCNGWAASSIIRAEPRFSKRDPVSGTTFSVADQKGILAETDYCVVNAFFGRRYRGSRGQDIRDIYPAEFHKTITYYIGQLGKPVALDYHRDSSVDNHIASGYSMTIKRTGADQLQVTAKLKVHKYDSSRSYPPGTAPSYIRTYRYTLRTGENGAVTGGSWLSTNPDFLWVPLSPTACGSNNQRINGAHAASILALPRAP